MKPTLLTIVIFVTLAAMLAGCGSNPNSSAGEKVPAGTVVAKPAPGMEAPEKK